MTLSTRCRSDRCDERAGRLRCGRQFESVLGSSLGHGRIEAETPGPSPDQFRANISPTRERLRVLEQSSV